MTGKEVSLICKAMSDENRLKVIEMLTKSEKCGCDLLEELQVTQPTLSHHMKVLAECGLVESRKDAQKGSEVKTSWHFHRYMCCRNHSCWVFFQHYTATYNLKEKCLFAFDRKKVRVRLTLTRKACIIKIKKDTHCITY